MASIWTLQLHSLHSSHRFLSTAVELRRTEQGIRYDYLNWSRKRLHRNLMVRAFGDSASLNGGKPAPDDGDNQLVSKHPFASFKETIISIPSLIVMHRGHTGGNIAIGLCIVASLLVIVVRIYVLKKSKLHRPGSVADLVRRGQLKSDRRGISKPLKYEDPFNNPLVKVGKGNSTVEICGKVYRLAPVTLTKEQQTIHQKRRSRAYQWKRPTVFLKEGDPVPPEVDPDTIRWIPANHPFATTVSEIDEDLAQNNVYQKHGVPFRIKAEHEALQRKLETLQGEQKLNNLVTDPSAIRDFGRPYKTNLKSNEIVEQNASDLELAPKPLKSNHAPSSPENISTFEEMQKP